MTSFILFSPVDDVEEARYLYISLISKALRADQRIGKY
jgi:hypothetical protein